MAAPSQGLIAGCRFLCLFVPRLAVFVGRDDSRRPPLGNGRVTGAGVAGTISRHPFDGLVIGDLARKVRQHGRVTDPAAGDVDGPDLHRIGVDAEMHLAPFPWVGWPVFPGKPLIVTLGLDPGAVRCPAVV